MNVKVEKHGWGYFLQDSKQAVAVVGSWADVIRVLKRWGR